MIHKLQISEYEINNVGCIFSVRQNNTRRCTFYFLKKSPIKIK